MTNKTDDYYARLRNLGEGVEETQGIPAEGFLDPNGQFPQREYFYASSVNKASKGETVNRLSIGGGDYGIDLEVPEQKPSIYPFNQIQETASGHSFEMDDTPGGERVLVKHRTGAGIELRADGTVIISSRNQKIEVVTGEAKTIVEGEGTLVYKGNLNLSVDGDFNVDVGGNYNINVAGDKVEDIKGKHSKTVNLDQNYTIRGARGEQVVGMATSTLLDDYNLIVAGDNKTLTQGQHELLVGGNLVTTAVNEWVAAASTANITARTVSMIGHKGTIGGPLLDHYGKTYGGLPGGITNLSTFYGTLVGKATEALHADYALYSGTADLAKGALKAVKASTKGPVTIAPPNMKPGIMPYTPLPPSAPIPNPAIVELQLSSSNYGIRNVVVDPKLKDKISKSDEYDDLFNHDPTIHEIRSKLRDRANYTNSTLTGYLVSQGKLNSNYKKNIPSNIGRSAAKKGTVRFGENLLGNNAIDNRSKRFRVNERGALSKIFGKDDNL